MLGQRFSCIIIFSVLPIFLEKTSQARDFPRPLGGGGRGSFVQTRGTHFVIDGETLYFNDFNAYWLMYMASDPSTRIKVTEAFQQASRNGLNVVRTWGFSDGGNDKPLHYSPGSYNENMFKGLDFVVSEAKKYRIRLILSLVNNWDNFGGKKQYNQWARDAGQSINNDNDFYSNSLVEEYFKNHIKAHPQALGLIGGSSFVQTRGTHFVIEGEALYFNGFNAYWLMYMASDPSTRVKVTEAFQQASRNGLNVVRTWAFSDGGNDKPLQYSPGSYNENMFKGLDFVVSEAKKYRIRLILSLVNNWDNFGGKKQYNQWARDAGQSINDDDDFYSNSLVKEYFKNHIKVILTRVNSISGVAYKDDPNIFAWELINEPQCPSDLSGKTLQAWIKEMAAHIKSIDKNHLLEVGLEGYYGESMPERKQYNPGYETGTDFISNNQLPEVDFTTIHLYPDQWAPRLTDKGKAEFVERWIEAHIEDSNSVLGKPLLITEFGKSWRSKEGYFGKRGDYFKNIFNMVYKNARNGGPCSGAIFWQLMTPGMEDWSDGYEVVLEQSPSTATIIRQQSHDIASLSSYLARSLKINSY